MRAVVLVGHGSLRADSGAAMIRLAPRVRRAGVAPIVAAGFLNYSRPTFAEALARCVAAGAGEVVVQPYFLVPGAFVRVGVPRLIAAGRALYPRVRFALAEPLGDHPALAELVLKRAAEADVALDGQTAPPARPADQTGLLIVAHGSPDPAANRAIEAVAAQVRAAALYVHVSVCFLELNEPGIGEAVARLVDRGIRRIVAVPYFLQLGGHVAEDLPAIVGAARKRHPAATIVLAGHLAYDPLLVAPIAERVAAAVAPDEVTR